MRCQQLGEERGAGTGEESKGAEGYGIRVESRYSARLRFRAGVRRKEGGGGGGGRVGGWVAEDKI